MMEAGRSRPGVACQGRPIPECDCSGHQKPRNKKTILPKIDKVRESPKTMLRKFNRSCLGFSNPKEQVSVHSKRVVETSLCGCPAESWGEISTRAFGSSSPILPATKLLSFPGRQMPLTNIGFLSPDIKEFRPGTLRKSKSRFIKALQRAKTLIEIGSQILCTRCEA